MTSWPSHGPAADGGLLSASCIQPHQLSFSAVKYMKLPCDCMPMHRRNTLMGSCSSRAYPWVQHQDVAVGAYLMLRGSTCSPMLHKGRAGALRAGRGQA